MPAEIAFNSEQLEFFRALELLRQPPGFVICYVDGEPRSIENRDDALQAAGAQQGQGVVHTVALCGAMPQSEKLEALGRLKRVEHLWCESWEWAEAIIRLLSPGSLTSLVVRNQAVGEEAACLVACTRLVQLELWDCRLGPGALAALAGRENLKTIKLSGCTLDEEAKRVLRLLPRLEHLGLNGTNLTDDDFALWDLPTTLEHINLSDTAVGDTTVKKLAGLKRLVGLLLADTEVTERSFEHLAAQPVLEAFDVSRTGISEDQLAAFLEEHAGVEHYDMKVVATDLK